MHRAPWYGEPSALPQDQALRAVMKHPVLVTCSAWRGVRYGKLNLIGVEQQQRHRPSARARRPPARRSGRACTCAASALNRSSLGLAGRLLERSGLPLHKTRCRGSSTHRCAWRWPQLYAVSRTCPVLGPCACRAGLAPHAATPVRSCATSRDARCRLCPAAVRPRT